MVGKRALAKQGFTMMRRGRNRDEFWLIMKTPMKLAEIDAFTRINEGIA